MISTGNVEILGDAKLRNRLANYYTDAATMEVTFDNVPPYRERLRLGMPARAQRVVRSQCLEVVHFDRTSRFFASGVTDGRCVEHDELQGVLERYG